MSQSTRRSRANDPAAHHGLLLLAWVLAWILLPLLILLPTGALDFGVTLTFVGIPVDPWYLAYGAPLALGVLVLRWIGSSFVTGYERVVGLRIIRRERVPRGSRVALYLCAALVLVCLILLLAGVRSLAIVLLTALATFVGLLLLMMQFSSIFGTTSIIGVVLGVAALIVVQSVATGFQHEFERRVLGVYAHINVTRTMGIAEYRRFERYLRTVDGVEGASPFAYYTMLLAPYKPEGASTDELRLKSVLVKGIDPETADQVIDIVDHLERGSGRPIELGALRSDFELMPVPDREDDQLPPVIAETPDPRGPRAYEDALKAYRALPEHKREAERMSEFNIDLDDDDDWPELSEEEGERLDPEDLPTIFVGATLAEELSLSEDSLVMVVDPGSSWDHSEEPKFQYYRVAGVFQAGFQEYDSRLIYTHIKELQRFKYRGKDIVSGVDLRLVDPNLAPVVGRAIRDDLMGREYQVLEWQNLNKNLFQSIRFQKNLITIILSLVITVATFNVLSALWTMVVRRNAEIAILMSMGATGGQVARIFQVTGMAIGLAGSLAGIGFGLMLSWLVELYGYTLDPEVYFI
ncbi:MAG: ABC transporter permease, partial [Myxococcales bacterium]|nr:ABC transporter permease [Myxococcales bacterium]